MQYINKVEIIDRCEIHRENIKAVRYSKQKDSFIIKTENTQPVDCWVDLELNGVIVGYRNEIIGTEGSIKIPAGKTKKIISEK